jgi:hypothetical protein
MSVRRRRLEVTMVNGPVKLVRDCFVYLRTRDLINVVFPTCHPLVNNHCLGGNARLGDRRLRQSAEADLLVVYPPAEHVVSSP